MVVVAVVVVGFLAHRAGDLTGDPSPWPYTMAALLGRGQRWIHAVNANGPQT